MGKNKRYEDVTGDVGTVIVNASGPVVLGSGDVVSGDDNSSDSGERTFSGKGMTVIKGDSHGTISRSFR